MPIVYGLESFKNAMKEHSDSYVLIGGGACSILYSQRGEDFRATNDLDIVLMTDRLSRDFAEDFWEYIKAGGYLCGGRNDAEVKYYRFTLPDERLGAGNPTMIELFARHPDFELTNEDAAIAPLPFDQDISSLSAIMLDDDYYNFLCSGIVHIDGIPLVDTLHIIPLKMRAHVDLHDRHDAGEHVNEKDLKKHRQDVMGLSGFLPPSESLRLNEQIAADVARFLDDMSIYSGRLTREREIVRVNRIVEQLRAVYL